MVQRSALVRSATLLAVIALLFALVPRVFAEGEEPGPTVSIEIMQIVSLSPRVPGVIIDHCAVIELTVRVSIDHGLSR